MKGGLRRSSAASLKNGYYGRPFLKLKNLTDIDRKQKIYYSDLWIARYDCMFKDNVYYCMGPDYEEDGITMSGYYHVSKGIYKTKYQCDIACAIPNQHDAFMLFLSEIKRYNQELGNAYVLDYDLIGNHTIFVL